MFLAHPSGPIVTTQSVMIITTAAKIAAVITITISQ